MGSIIWEPLISTIAGQKNWQNTTSMAWCSSRLRTSGFYSTFSTIRKPSCLICVRFNRFSIWSSNPIIRYQSPRKSTIDGNSRRRDTKAPSQSTQCQRQMMARIWYKCIVSTLWTCSSTSVKRTILRRSRRSHSRLVEMCSLSPWSLKL